MDFFVILQFNFDIFVNCTYFKFILLIFCAYTCIFQNILVHSAVCSFTRFLVYDLTRTDNNIVIQTILTVCSYDFIHLLSFILI